MYFDLIQSFAKVFILIFFTLTNLLESKVFILDNFNSWFSLTGAPTPPPIDPCLPKFQCRLNGACISRSKVCDFVSDCPGGTDEESAVCGYPQGFEKSIEPWKHSKHESYEFQLIKGSTQTFGTGPKTDARGEKDGKS